MNLIQEFEEAKAALYEHVGFVEDWVVCPIDDTTHMYWDVDDDVVRYAPDIELFHSDGKYYEDDIYKQRFYSKWVYEGRQFTMIFCDPHVDGAKWFRVFDNTKRVKVL
jgi:hypothetical protein